MDWSEGNRKVCLGRGEMFQPRPLIDSVPVEERRKGRLPRARLRRCLTDEGNRAKTWGHAPRWPAAREVKVDMFGGDARVCARNQNWSIPGGEIVISEADKKAGVSDSNYDSIG